MDGSVSVSVDRHRRILTFVASGFFDEEAFTRVAIDRAAALRSLGGPPNAHYSIVDVTDCKIQKQDLVARFAALIGDPRNRARRIAFVTGSGSLIRMQVRRLISNTDVAALFVDRPSAEAWLLAPASDAA